MKHFINKGDRVIHSRFGKGTVSSVDYCRAHILFDDNSEREIMIGTNGKLSLKRLQ